MSVKTSWFAPKVYQKIEKQLNQNLKRAAVFVANQTKKQLGEAYPPASKPGEPPALRFGELRRSIAWEVDESAHVARVGSNKDYAGYLERGTSKMDARPFLQRTLNENWKVVAHIIAGRPV